jgi:CheY-like chemotaxis protein
MRLWNDRSKTKPPKGCPARGRNKMKRILIVDDDSDMAELVMDKLKKYRTHITAHTISRGENVLPFLKGKVRFSANGMPHVILLDLHMPGKDGFAVLKELKSNREFKRIPVVILSSTVSQTEIDRCYEAGVNSVISKSHLPHGVLDRFAEFWLDMARLPRTG